jgi:hypothetical protein
LSTLKGLSGFFIINYPCLIHFLYGENKKKSSPEKSEEDAG